ncbi:diaminopimelate decarboxylase [Paracoccaceae bacterium]|nr:diaminopimelate decarboxylase [Paracoccaceae bacterium]MDC3205299.1 diaminopimelate decarboxylase [Paracoccaceae bacterium]
MDHFSYKSGILHAEDASIKEIAKKVGTPFYVYSTATLRRHFDLFESALSGIDHLICYAVKAASNQAILRTLANFGAGMDVVSGGEYKRAREAGVEGSQIVFSGVGKTGAEMKLALTEGVRQFNVESEEELLVLSAIAHNMDKVAPITIRVNPDVDAKTHEKIATGKAENKFGIPISRAREVYAKAASLPGIQVVGIDVHIGSQLTQLLPFEEAYKKLADLTEMLRSDGHEIKRLDLGGGLGIPYGSKDGSPPTPKEYGQMIKRVLGHLNCEIEIEPGRLLVGNAGLLVSKVIYVKKGHDREFLILDAAMNDLLRPALYEAYHDIVPVMQPSVNQKNTVYDVVGPVCETGDTFAKSRTMHICKPGELVAFRSAGAYGAAMASEYNTRPLVPEVLVNNSDYSEIRERPTLDEIIGRDKIPNWL